VNKFAQEVLGRYDASDIALMNEAFSSDPPKPDRPACGAQATKLS
jgi:hypothetical protein